MGLLSLLVQEMIKYEKGVPQRAGHFLKVYGYAKSIGELENLPEDVQLILETAAIVHDIGIKPSLQKYGSSAGSYQEREGGPAAREMLVRLGFSAEVTDRVAYLVGHHHTYSNVDGLDYQILLEADFLVNMLESEMAREEICSAYDKVFRTLSGKRFCALLYLSDETGAQP